MSPSRRAATRRRAPKAANDSVKPRAAASKPAKSTVKSRRAAAKAKAKTKAKPADAQS